MVGSVNLVGCFRIRIWKLKLVENCLTEVDFSKSSSLSRKSKKYCVIKIISWRDIEVKSNVSILVTYFLSVLVKKINGESSKIVSLLVETISETVLWLVYVKCVLALNYFYEEQNRLHSVWYCWWHHILKWKIPALMLLRIHWFSKLF